MNTDVFETVPQNASLSSNMLQDVAKIDYKSIMLLFRARSDAVGWGGALQTWRSRVRFPMRSLGISIDLILLAAL